MASGRSTRDARQAKVAEMRAAAAKAEARRRNLLISSVVAILAVVIVVGFVVVRNASGDDKSSSSSATPANLGETSSIVDGEDTAPVKVIIYEDFQCPYCAQFESANRELLASYVKDGDVQVQYRPIAFLDRASTDDYSTRALNAVAAVQNSSPDSFLEFHNLLFDNQPEEGGAGLTDDQLVKYAVEAGADEATIKKAVDDLTYESWTEDVTDQASKDGISGTPTVTINGTKLESIDAASTKTAVDKALKAAK